VDRHAAARMKITADTKPFGLEQRDQLFTDRDRTVLMVGAVITEAIEIKLQRFRFYEPAAWCVIDDEGGEIRLAGNWANRREFRKSEARDIIAVGMRVRHPIEHRVARRGRDGRRAAELGRLWHGQTVMAPCLQASLYRRRCSDNIMLPAIFGLSRMTITGLI